MEEQEDEYELLPHEQVEHLRREVEILKGNPFIKDHTSDRLLSAVQNLTDSVEKLYSLFENVNKELLAEYGEKGEGPDSKLNKILEQNKHIAKGILTLAETVKEEPQKPKQEDKKAKTLEERRKFDEEFRQHKYNSLNEEKAEPQPTKPYQDDITQNKINTKNTESPREFQEKENESEFTSKYFKGIAQQQSKPRIQDKQIYRQPIFGLPKTEPEPEEIPKFEPTGTSNQEKQFQSSPAQIQNFQMPLRASIQNPIMPPIKQTQAPPVNEYNTFQNRIQPSQDIDQMPAPPYNRPFQQVQTIQPIRMRQSNFSQATKPQFSLNPEEIGVPLPPGKERKPSYDQISSSDYGEEMLAQDQINQSRGFTPAVSMSRPLPDPFARKSPVQPYNDSYPGEMNQNTSLSQSFPQRNYSRTETMIKPSYPTYDEFPEVKGQAPKMANPLDIPVRQPRKKILGMF